MDESSGNATERVVFRFVLADAAQPETELGRGEHEAELGNGSLPPGLDRELSSMQPGESREFELTAEEGYGERSEEEVAPLPREMFGEGVGDLQPGVEIEGEMGGQMFRARVVEVRDDEVVLDFNHPLAGMRTKWKVEMVQRGPAGAPPSGLITDV